MKPNNSKLEQLLVADKYHQPLIRICKWDKNHAGLTKA